ncbi:hypothetical protein [Chenggangzhangella methanolivorans]|uniref:Uncharacterized protein n=1 Tax=Chenggangzhangella methanolivorans TaxID=1437009 RepID=A0A9E6ULZ2_9HYPH|nr:hypothetical protein [Chenggangzhangella methanolivorans]QZN99520.1 hypothetical protein K6K41_22870 [Chenggangzhangella methanolivorans]
MAKTIRKFFQLLGLIERNRFEQACDEALAKSIEALQVAPEGKGKATITLTVEIAVQKEMINVVPKIVVKLPDDKAFRGTPFFLWEGEITTQHPNQMDMLEPREVGASRHEPAHERA